MSSEPAAARDSPPSAFQVPILVVDDIEDNRDLLEQLLIDEGYEEILFASNGLEALETLETRSDVGLVLLDLQMPDMDGYEACRRIVASEKTSHIPVIVVTGGALRRDEALVKSFEAGAMDYIPKPVNEVEMYGRVKSALQLYIERIENRRKTAALAESEQRYDLAVNGVNDGIWDINFATGEFYYSPKWKEILGYEPKELPNEPGVWESLIHPEDKDRVLGVIHQHWKERTPYYTSEHRLRTRSGDYKWVFSRGRAVWDEQGEVIRMAGSTTDITARKHLETQLRQAQQMESIGRLAAGVAHDFNNLLTAIMGHVDLGRRRLPAGSPVLENLDKISKASAQAAEFCRQLLAYTGQGRYMVESIDLNPLVQETSEIVRVSISRKISIDFDLCKEPLVVSSDASQFRQIILNLLINAAEAIGENAGTITVRTSTVDLAEEDLSDAVLPREPLGGPHARIDVVDTGCGISAEEQKKIFDPFFTTKFTGRGLGLSAVLGIVKANQGVLKLASQPGAGSCFTLYLPAQEASTPSAPRVVDTDEDWRGSGAVLVVEDEAIIREVAEAFLVELGFDVLLASDGVEGIEQFQLHRDKIVAVILDLNMPNMSGDEAFDRIHEIDPNARILIATGYSEEEAVRRFTGEGSAGFLQKPFMIDELSAKLRDCLKRRPH